MIRYINKVAKSVKLGLFNELSKYIMVGEFKSVKNVCDKMNFILCDEDTHEIVDILPNDKIIIDRFHLIQALDHELNK